MKIIIVGGGIAGLSAAHFLSKYSDFDITIIESEDDIGGQARSMYGQYCYIEYSWRVFGTSYHNLNKIINEIGADKNFTLLEYPCIINKNKTYYNGLDKSDIIKILLENKDYYTINKLSEITTICRERAINNYDNIYANKYFQDNDIIKTVLGPFLGLEANKLSLSGYYKNLLSITDTRKFHFTPEKTRISKYPTQESLFNIWKKYLLNKGVKILTSTNIIDINIFNDKIIDITCKNKANIFKIKADNYIFAFSLKKLNLLIDNNNYFANRKIKYDFKKLEEGLQLYYTINMYFSIDFYGNNVCNEIVLADTPWKLIIQRKYFWKNNYLNKCNKNNIDIKDVFNVGFLDNNKGILFNKFVSECSKEEAIEEGIYQFKNSNFFKNLLSQKNITFDDCFLGYEDYYQFYNDENNKLKVTNPKFSININLNTFMPDTPQPSDIPENLFLAGYYVKSTMGGVSMEASCETGLNAGLFIANKYNKKIKTYPIKHNVEYANITTIGLVYFDKLLYELNLPPLHKFIPALLIILIYFIILIYLIVKIYKTITSRKNKINKNKFIDK